MNDKYNSIVSKIKTEEINLNSIERNDEYIDLLEIEKELKDNLNLLNKEIFSLYPVIIKSIKPYKAISPRKLNYLLSGIFFGIVISLVIIFLKTYKNNRVS